MTTPDTLELDPDRRLAYSRIHTRGEGANLPGVVFLGGFRSDMTGTKATWLADWAAARGRAFLRFDYRGHGASSARFEDGCIGDWADDAAEAVARLTEGPQILVGSSMGGWIALLLARRMPERIAGIVGIAAAPDFTDSIPRAFSEAQRAEFERTGRTEIASYPGEPAIPVTRRLIEDGAGHRVLDAPLDLPFPVRLLQGTADEDVPQDVAVRLLGHLESPDARLLLVKDADHRFSAARELGILGATLEEITAAIRGAGA